MMRGMRALLGICAFVIAGLVALSTFSSGPPTSTALHSLVTQTHHQLNQLHKLGEELGGDQPLDNSVLNDLGFVDNPILFPNHSWTNISTPVIVSAVASRQTRFVPELIRVAQMLSLNSTLVIYALDLSEDQVREVDNECNETCVLIQFDFSPYPPHVKDSRLGAYRPIIIQEMLQRAAVVFWLDPCMQILENASLNWLSIERSPLDYWMKRSLRSGGVLVWPLGSPAPHLPTAALTHPDMFPAFRTYKRNYDFQQMSDPRVTLIVNTPIIHRRLLRPWVSCALTPSCLSPIGAQDTGCKYNKKPLFRYSGCHLYDASAFNVALGLAFGMDNASYLEPTATFACASSSSYSRWHAPNAIVESSPSQAVAGPASPPLAALRSLRGPRRRHIPDGRSRKAPPLLGRVARRGSAGIEREGLAGDLRGHIAIRTFRNTTPSPVLRKRIYVPHSPTAQKGATGKRPLNITAIYNHATRPSSSSPGRTKRRR